MIQILPPKLHQLLVKNSCSSMSIHPFGLRLTEDISYNNLVSVVSVQLLYSRDVHSRGHQ
jgi:hypothetical protein